MTAHPDKDILIFFGGEYFNGHKVNMPQYILLYTVLFMWFKKHNYVSQMNEYVHGQLETVVYVSLLWHKHI